MKIRDIGSLGLSVFLVVAFSGTNLLAQVDTQGQIIGRVVNKTPGGKLPPSLEVSLLALQEQGVEAKSKASVGLRGEFRFAGIPLTGGGHFLVSTRYNGVDYVSAPVSLTKEAPRATVEVRIYEVTSSDQDIRIRNLHVLVEPFPGYMSVTFVVVVENAGNRAYLPEAKEKDKGIVVSLPMGFSQVTPVEGLDPDSTQLTPQGLVINKAIPPGNGQFFLSFKLGARSSFDWYQKLDYPTERFNLFLPRGGINLVSSIMKEGEPFMVKGQPYRRFQASGLAKGSALSFKIQGLPSAGINFKWPLAAFLTALILAGLVYGLVKRRSQG